MSKNHARWATAAICAVTLSGWGCPSVQAQEGPRPPAPQHTVHPVDPHTVDRLAGVLERLDRLADRLDRAQGGPQPVPHMPQAGAHPDPQPPHQVAPHGAGPHGVHVPQNAPHAQAGMSPGQLPPPLLEMLAGRDRQLAEMREMFEVRAREMAEAHERQMGEMREAMEARFREMAEGGSQQGQAMMAEMGQQVAETRKHVEKTLQGMGMFKEQIEGARRAMGEFKERAEQGQRRFEEMADRIGMLEREIDRLHAELRERREHDDDEGDD